MPSSLHTHTHTCYPFNSGDHAWVRNVIQYMDTYQTWVILVAHAMPPSPPLSSHYKRTFCKQKVPEGDVIGELPVGRDGGTKRWDLGGQVHCHSVRATPFTVSHQSKYVVEVRHHAAGFEVHGVVVCGFVFPVNEDDHHNVISNVPLAFQLQGEREGGRRGREGEEGGREKREGGRRGREGEEGGREKREGGGEEGGREKREGGRRGREGEEGGRERGGREKREGGRREGGRRGREGEEGGREKREGGRRGREGEEGGREKREGREEGGRRGREEEGGEKREGGRRGREGEEGGREKREGGRRGREGEEGGRVDGVADMSGQRRRGVCWTCALYSSDDTVNSTKSPTRSKMHTHTCTHTHAHTHTHTRTHTHEVPRVLQVL